MMWRTALIGLMVLGTTPLWAEAAEKQVKKSEVPKVVLDAAAAKYPKADMTGFAREEGGGKTFYEVQLQLGGEHIELILSPEGKVVTEERTLSMKDLPEPVRKAFSSSPYSRANVRKVEKVTESDKPEAPRYEILVEQGGDKHELVFAHTGELKNEEKKDEDDED